MKKTVVAPVAASIMAAVAWAGAFSACGRHNVGTETSDGESVADSASSQEALPDRDTVLHEDSIAAVKADSLTRYERLTDEDFRLVADELGVELAAVKAVVLVEAGTEMKGFYAPGVPVVNFDPSVYRQYGKTAPDTSGDPNAKVPSGLTGYALKEWTQLTNARKVNAQGADMGTFWGMFQIGGFCYKVCECQSVMEFVEKMSESELSQLELFAKFIKNSGMLKYLKSKDWARFSRAYNGPNYASRGYHTKMANAYRKFSSQK